MIAFERSEFGKNIFKHLPIITTTFISCDQRSFEAVLSRDAIQNLPVDASPCRATPNTTPFMSPGSMVPSRRAGLNTASAFQLQVTVLLCR